MSHSEWVAKMRELIAYLKEQRACASYCDENENDGISGMIKAVEEGLLQLG